MIISFLKIVLEPTSYFTSMEFGDKIIIKDGNLMKYITRLNQTETGISGGCRVDR